MKLWRSGAVFLFVALCGPASGQSPKLADAPQCDYARFRTFIDVGHSLEEPGATSARGVPEFDFNLRLSLHVERALRDAGFSNTVLLVTDGKAMPSLMKRMARANKQGGDLFLSIHHDSVPERFIEKWTFEGVDRPYSDRFRGHSLFVSADNPQFKASLHFGSLLGKAMKARGLQYTPHYTDKIMGNRMRLLVDKEAGVYRFDQLVVLRMAAMPSLLLEGGSIINRDEELLMGSTEQQEKIASAVLTAVEAFCTIRTPRKPARTGAARK